MNRPALLLLVLFALLMGPAQADPHDLGGGVLCVHAPPGLNYSLGTKTWCESVELEDSEGQVTRIDPGRAAVWFIVSAWSEEKTFDAVEFGLGDFDPRSFEFVADGLCLDGALAIEHPSAGTWPAPNRASYVLPASGPLCHNSKRHRAPNNVGHKRRPTSRRNR